MLGGKNSNRMNQLAQKPDKGYIKVTPVEDPKIIEKTANAFILLVWPGGSDPLLPLNLCFQR